MKNGDPTAPLTSESAQSETGFYSDAPAIFDEVFDLYGVLDRSGSVLDLHGSIFQQTNTDPALLIGQRFSETVFWQSSENTAKLLERAIGESVAGKTQTVLLDFRVSADNKVAVEVHIQPLSDGLFISAREVLAGSRRVGHYKQELDELISAAENAEIGLWYWDLKAGNIYSTPMCNALFGIPAYDVLTYESFLEKVHPEDRDRVNTSLIKAHANGTKYYEEYRVVYSDGSVEWLVAEGKSFLDGSGQPEKMTSAVRKITEQRLAEEDLAKVYDREKKARDEAVEANRAKDFFLAFVSHELRSPLNAILGWSRILLTKQLDDETRKNALETIERSARFQTKLINDLVDSARVASGKLRLEFRPTNLYEVVRMSYQSQKPIAETHNISFELTADSTDTMVFADAGRLQQVFGNLISNALKFTPDGGSVRIDVGTTPDAVTVRVIDSGRGISAEALPSIFRQFSQVDSVGDTSKGGLGLGLSIVNILVAKHGGTVTAESDGVGKGATFTVTIPLSAKTGGTTSTSADTVREKPLSGIKVLLVEDDPDSREVLEIFLSQNGAKVDSAESAAAADKILVDSQPALPNVIVSDLAMPGEDGYSFMARVRAMPPERGSEIPALALSAFTTAESKQKAFDAGFTRYSTKPFEPDVLIRDILELAMKAKRKP